MAVIGANLPIENGSASDWTFYKRNGKTIGRQKHQSHHPSSERTADRMVTRVKWNNLLNVWREMGPLLRGLFETKRPGLTDYNAFMGQNMPLVTVYVPRRESGKHITMIENYVVSQGSLMPPIELKEEGDVWMSNIYAGSVAFTDECRWGQLAYNIVQLNGGMFRNGDELQLIEVEQVGDRIRGTSGVIRLEESDRRTMGSSGWERALTVRNGFLAVRRREETLVALVQRRVELDERGRKRLRVTSQMLVGENSLTRIYSDEYALEDALNSYDNYLPPNWSAPRPNKGEGPAAPAHIVVMVEAQVVPPGSGEVLGGGETPVGEEVALRAVPREGFRFLCWDNGRQSPELRLKVEGQMSLKAIFAEE